jgi:hypothetical protein
MNVIDDRIRHSRQLAKPPHDPYKVAILQISDSICDDDRVPTI